MKQNTCEGEHFEHNDAKSISCLLIHFLPAVRFNTFISAVQVYSSSAPKIILNFRRMGRAIWNHLLSAVNAVMFPGFRFWKILDLLPSHSPNLRTICKANNSGFFVPRLRNDEEYHFSSEITRSKKFSASFAND